MAVGVWGRIEALLKVVAADVVEAKVDAAAARDHAAYLRMRLDAMFPPGPRVIPTPPGPPVHPNGLTPPPIVDPPLGPPPAPPVTTWASHQPQPVSVFDGQTAVLDYDVPALARDYHINGLHSPAWGPSGSGEIEGWVIAPNGRVIARTILESGVFRMRVPAVAGRNRLCLKPRGWSGTLGVKFDA